MFIAISLAALRISDGLPQVPVVPRNIGTFRHTGFKDAQRGFKFESAHFPAQSAIWMDELTCVTTAAVLCSVFHPCEAPPSGAKRVVWFPKLSQTINGFLKVIDLLSLFCEPSLIGRPYRWLDVQDGSTRHWHTLLRQRQCTSDHMSLFRLT